MAAIASVPFAPRDLAPEVQVELKKAFNKNIVAQCDMPAELLSEATDVVVSALDKTRSNYELAARTVKEAMDRKFGAEVCQALSFLCASHSLCSGIV